MLTEGRVRAIAAQVALAIVRKFNPNISEEQIAAVQKNAESAIAAKADAQEAAARAEEAANRLLGVAVVGVIDENGKLVLTGLLEAGTYTAYYEVENDDGTKCLVEIGELTLGGEEPAEPVTYTVDFMVDGVTVATVTYEAGATSIEEPAVPAKDGYTGVWETYDLSNGGNITVNAVYTAIEIEPADPTNFFKSTPVVTDKVYGADDVILAGGRVNDSGEYRHDGGRECLLTNYISVQAGDEVEMTNLSFYTTLKSAMYKSDKTMIGGFLPESGDYVTDVTTNGTVQRFKIAHADAGYVRICGAPDSGILKDSTAGLKVHERYDLTQVIVNVKRGGEYL